MYNKSLEMNFVLDLLYG